MHSPAGALESALCRSLVLATVVTEEHVTPSVQVDPPHTAPLGTPAQPSATTAPPGQGGPFDDDEQAASVPMIRKAGAVRYRSR
jgi:hypothetical protein